MPSGWFLPGGLLLAATVVGTSALARTVYVAPTGNDTNPGTSDRPVSSLTKARDMLRASAVGGDKRIVVRGGAYYDVHLSLTPEDSGLTIEAAPGQTPVLYGGKRITGWQQEGGELWAAPLAGVKERTWDFRLLIVNDEVRPRARLPREGRFTHLNPYKIQPREGVTPAPTVEELTTLRFRAADLGAWFDVNNAELTIYHDWNESLVGAKSVDFNAGVLTFSIPATYPPGAWNNHTYVVWNLRQGIQRPGQWCLDRTNGRLLYRPRDGETMAAMRAVAPTGESIIRIEGTKDRPVVGITLAGLSLQCTTTPLAPSGWAAGRYAGAIHGEYARDCRLRSLEVSNVGGQGIYLQHSENPSADECHVHHTGAGGIYFVGQGGVITNCRVHHVGESFPSGIGIRVMGAKHAVRHNEVHDTPYCGIEGGSSAAIIEGNRISDFMQVLHDGGAIYNSYNSMANPCRDVVIRANLVFYKDRKARPRARAYYLDEQSWNCLVEGNVAVNTRAPCFLHITTDCTVRNNVFIDEGDVDLWWNSSKGVRFEQNIVYATGQVRHPGSPTTWKNNLFYSLAGKYAGIPDDQTRADPRLRDWKHGNYSFGPDSPAMALGIKVVDVGSAGPQSQHSGRTADPKSAAEYDGHGD
jgi:hypothetical protein